MKHVVSLDSDMWWEVTVDLVWSVMKMIGLIVQSWWRFFYVPRKSLKGELILVTGAAGGIGSLISRKLAEKGAILILWDINKERNESLAADICAEGGQAYAFTCNLLSTDDIHATADLVRSKVGNPTILINNAGLVAGKYILDLTHEDVSKTFGVNTLAHYWTVMEFLPSMLEANHGHIVSVASIFGVDSIAGVSDYGPSKFGAVGLMKSLRQEIRILEKDGVHCTTVMPYHAATEMFQGTAIRFQNLPFLNVLQPEFVADSVVTAMEKNQISVFVPRILYFLIFFMSFLPDKAFDVCHDFLETNYAMKTFSGRQGSAKGKNLWKKQDKLA